MAAGTSGDNKGAESRRTIAAQAQMKGRLFRLFIVLAGLVIGQAVLYWPSLIGRKILLPLDYLASQGIYIPSNPGVAPTEPQSPSLSDLVLLFEPARRFAVSELHAGRLPLWEPSQFAGAPFIWPKYSPFLALECCTASPVILAWAQMLEAIIAGLGAFLFFRRVAGVGFWPAAIAAWCYPFTGFFVFWLGFTTSLPVCWLPWILLAVHNVTGQRSRLAPIGLAFATCLVLTSGHPDVAAQVLLISGIYGLYRLWTNYRDQVFQPRARKTAIMLALGWSLGFMLAAPHVLPLLDYVSTGARTLERSGGLEERPPVGLAALPEAVLPDLYGTNTPGKSLRYFDADQIESAAAAYAGVIATLVLAPLAWSNRKVSGLNLFCAGLCAFGLAWCANVPGIVQVFRLPGLNMFSHNRWTFGVSFAILTMTAGGLEVIRTGPIQWRWWHWLPAALLAGLAMWCLFRRWFPPEYIASELEVALRAGRSTYWIHNLDDVHRTQMWFARHYIGAATACGLGFAVWLLLRYRPAWQPGLFPVLGVLVVGDLLWFAHGRNPQCDPSLYYPPIPILQEVARSTPGRIIGSGCLPASLASVCGLRDIRGYDSIDPARLVQLLKIAEAANSLELPYAKTEWLVPKITVTREGTVRLSPVLDMLGVRYIITRLAPPDQVRFAFHDQDYWVLVNSNALPRAFVPNRIEMVEDEDACLLKLASPDFDPRALAYVNTPVTLPAACRGSAELTSEISTRVTLAVRMESPGLVVLADLWDAGWHAYRDGERVPILRANHAVRGVLMPAGNCTLEFRYEPASFRTGVALAGIAAIVILIWSGKTLPKTIRLANRDEPLPGRNP